MVLEKDAFSETGTIPEFADLHTAEHVPPAHGAARLMVGLLGGTFDPIHFGHLRFAEEMLEALGLADVRLIPAGKPPHRSAPHAAAEHRLAMVKLALAGHPVLRADTREVESPELSYTINTLLSVRGEIGEQPLCLLMGADAFAGLASWKRWQEFVALCHIVVATRPGHDVSSSPAALKDFWQDGFGAPARALATRPAGLVVFQEITALDISASRIRALLQEQRSARYLLPDEVLRYIERHRLYRSTL
jgi:nicotinate-nucleotide adenylyltransferase